MSSERLQKFMARAGIASRRRCEGLISQGRVRVNGEECRELGVKIDPLLDVVELDGVRIHPASDKAVIVLNKPKGYLSSMSDRFGRPCVSDLVPKDEHAGLFPVGRLDLDTTGVLLFTNDGNLGNALCHPSRNVSKLYIATVGGMVTEGELDKLRDGVMLEDGMTSPAKCALLSVKSAPRICSVVSMEIHEGKKRQVKRMFAYIGHEVFNLHRQRFGPVSDNGLKPGEWRLLGEEEIEHLRSAPDSG